MVAACPCYYKDKCFKWISRKLTAISIFQNLQKKCWKWEPKFCGQPPLFFIIMRFKTRVIILWNILFDNVVPRCVGVVGGLVHGGGDAGQEAALPPHHGWQGHPPGQLHRGEGQAHPKGTHQHRTQASWQLRERGAGCGLHQERVEQYQGESQPCTQAIHRYPGNTQ